MENSIPTPTGDWTIKPEGNPTLEERVAAVEKWIDWQQSLNNEAADRAKTRINETDHHRMAIREECSWLSPLSPEVKAAAESQRDATEPFVYRFHVDGPAKVELAIDGGLRTGLSIDITPTKETVVNTVDLNAIPHNPDAANATDSQRRELSERLAFRLREINQLLADYRAKGVVPARMFILRDGDITAHNGKRINGDHVVIEAFGPDE